MLIKTAMLSGLGRYNLISNGSYTYNFQPNLVFLPLKHIFNPTLFSLCLRSMSKSLGYCISELIDSKTQWELLYFTKSPTERSDNHAEFWTRLQALSILENEKVKQIKSHPAPWCLLLFQLYLQDRKRKLHVFHDSLCTVISICLTSASLCNVATNHFIRPLLFAANLHVWWLLSAHILIVHAIEYWFFIPSTIA